MALRTLTLSITLSVFSVSAFSADWYSVKNFDDSTLYIDKDSIQPLKNSSIKLAYKLEKNDESVFLKGVTIMRCKFKTHTLQSLRISRVGQSSGETMNINEDEQKTVPVEGYNIPLYEYVCKS